MRSLGYFNAELESRLANANAATRVRAFETKRVFLAARLRFRFGKTTIEEQSQRTARLLPQKTVEFALVEPNALAVFTALDDAPEQRVLLESSRTLRTSRHLRLTPRRLGFVKLEPHIFDQLKLLSGEIAILIGAFVEVCADSIRWILHEWISLRLMILDAGPNNPSAMFSKTCSRVPARRISRLYRTPTRHPRLRPFAMSWERSGDELAYFAAA